MITIALVIALSLGPTSDWTLSDGTKAKFEFVCRDPKAAWDGDGHLTKWDPILDQTPADGQASSPAQPLLVLFLKAPKKIGEGLHVIFKLPKGISMAGQTDSRGLDASREILISAPSAKLPLFSDFRIGIAAGPWKTVGWAELMKRGVGFSPVKQSGFGFSPILEKLKSDDPEYKEPAYICRTGKLGANGRSDFRFVFTDRAGRKYDGGPDAEPESAFPRDPASPPTFGGRPVEWVRIELQTRAWQWHTFSMPALRTK